MADVKFYVCKDCGDVVVKAVCHGGELSCNGHKMEELVAGTTDAAQEKHVPEVTREGNKIHVVVGSVEHPMTEEHLIEFIACVQGDQVQIQKLTAEDEPKACFNVCDGPVTVYEYCNLHGLWKAEA